MISACLHGDTVTLYGGDTQTAGRVQWCRTCGAIRWEQPVAGTWEWCDWIRPASTREEEAAHYGRRVLGRALGIEEQSSDVPSFAAPSFAALARAIEELKKTSEEPK